MTTTIIRHENSDEDGILLDDSHLHGPLDDVSPEQLWPWELEETLPF